MPVLSDPEWAAASMPRARPETTTKPASPSACDSPRAIRWPPAEAIRAPTTRNALAGHQGVRCPAPKARAGADRARPDGLDRPASPSTIRRAPMRSPAVSSASMRRTGRAAYIRGRRPFGPDREGPPARARHCRTARGVGETRRGRRGRRGRAAGGRDARLGTGSRPGGAYAGLGSLEQPGDILVMADVDQHRRDDGQHED